MTRVNVEIDDELHKQAKLSAVSQGKTLIRYINEAIGDKIKTDGKRKP